MHGYGDHVQALDAVTGDLLWQYARRLPRGVRPSQKRGFSIYGHRLYVPTSDMHIVALDVKTGEVLWDTAVADHEARDLRPRLTGGPLVAKGKVIMGTTGRQPHVIALDAETGEEVWRFYSIAPWRSTPTRVSSSGTSSTRPMDSRIWTGRSNGRLWSSRSTEP